MTGVARSAWLGAAVAIGAWAVIAVIGWAIAPPACRDAAPLVHLGLAAALVAGAAGTAAAWRGLRRRPRDAPADATLGGFAGLLGTLLAGLFTAGIALTWAFVALGSAAC